MPHRSLSARQLRGLRAFLVVGLLFTIPCGVLVRDAGAGDADKVAARAHYETATRLYDVREYADALKEFKAAYLAKPDPAFLFNIGQCHFKMGKNQEALDFFQQFLKKAPADDPNRGLVEARIRNLQAGRGADSEAIEGPAAKPVAPLAAPPEVANPPPAPLAVVPMEAAPSPGVDVSVKSAAQEGQAVSPETPFYSTWWFWTGVSAVVVGGAVATYLLLSRGGGTSVPDSTLGARTLP